MHGREPMCRREGPTVVQEGGPNSGAGGSTRVVYWVICTQSGILDYTPPGIHHLGRYTLPVHSLPVPPSVVPTVGLEGGVSHF